MQKIQRRLAKFNRVRKRRIQFNFDDDMPDVDDTWGGPAPVDKSS